jgi:hypothetical protein
VKARFETIDDPAQVFSQVFFGPGTVQNVSYLLGWLVKLQPDFFDHGFSFWFFYKILFNLSHPPALKVSNGIWFKNHLV